MTGWSVEYDFYVQTHLTTQSSKLMTPFSLCSLIQYNTKYFVGKTLWFRKVNVLRIVVNHMSTSFNKNMMWRDTIQTYLRNDIPHKTVHCMFH
jgi:arabinogalactan endo-1,4-beta-galactosidase